MLEEGMIRKCCGSFLAVLSLICLGFFLYTAYFGTVSCAAIAILLVSWAAFSLSLKCLIVLFKCKIKVTKVNPEGEVIDDYPAIEIKVVEPPVITVEDKTQEEVVELDQKVVVEEPEVKVDVTGEATTEKPKTKAKKSKAKAEQAE